MFGLNNASITASIGKMKEGVYGRQSRLYTGTALAVASQWGTGVDAPATDEEKLTTTKGLVL